MNLSKPNSIGRNQMLLKVLSANAATSTSAEKISGQTNKQTDKQTNKQTNRTKTRPKPRYSHR